MDGGEGREPGRRRPIRIVVMDNHRGEGMVNLATFNHRGDGAHRDDGRSR